MIIAPIAERKWESMTIKEMQLARELFEKTSTIIESCLTTEHLQVCEKWLQLARNKMGEGYYNYVMMDLINKQKELNDG